MGEVFIGLALLCVAKALDNIASAIRPTPSKDKADG